LGLLQLGEDGLLASGTLELEGGGAAAPRISLVLRSVARTLVFPAQTVPSAASQLVEAPRAAAGLGFRSLVPSAALPAGRYRIGLLVERSDGAWLSFHRGQLAVPERS
jgi:hypothetical protein